MESPKLSNQLFTHVLREWVETFMRRSMQDFMEFSRGSGLSMPQLSVLLHLYYGVGVAVSDIGEHLGVTNPAASQMVDRLVHQNLLERSECPDDRRMKMLALTPKGKELVEESIEARRRWMQQLTTTLTPEEQESISAALIALTQAAQALEAKEHHH
jgi:DNA-binding MarR family transcriptional regulator